MTPERTVEDYIKAVYKLQRTGARVTTSALAAELRLADASITDMIKKLSRKGYLRYVPYQGVDLTEQGRRTALKIVRRHRLWEMYLVRFLKFSWDKVHDEAERLEHAVSADFESKLVQKLGRGGLCPHGNLMTPEDAASRKKRGLTLLSTAETGKPYMVRSIYERDRRLLEFLESRGIRPGAWLRLLERNYDQTLTVANQVGSFPLGAAAAERVWVEKQKTPATPRKSALTQV